MTEIATPYVSMVETEEAPRWNVRCLLGNEGLGELETGTVSYDDDGASSLDVEIYDDGYFETRARHRRVDVWVQRGLSARWHYVFTGEVQHAKTNDTGLTKIEAFGPRNLLARRYFEKKVTYLNMPLRNFIAEIRDHFDERDAVFDIGIGTDFLVENEPFSGQTSLLDGLDKVLKAAYYVAADRPDYRLLVLPRPRPGIRRARFGGPVEITPADYGPKSLDIPQNPEGPWAQVIAYRNDDEGEEIWRQSASITNLGGKVNENQIYWLDDFPGDSASAARQVALIAKALEQGAVVPKVKGIPFRTPLFTHDPVDLVEIRENVNANEVVRGKRVRYACTIKNSKLDLTKGKYDVELDGTEIDRRPYREDQSYEKAGPYVVKTTAGMI